MGIAPNSCVLSLLDFAPASCLDRYRQIRFDRKGYVGQVDHVVSEAFDMPREERAQGADILPGHLIPFPFQLPLGVGHIDNVLENKYVGHEVLELDALLLLFGIVFSNDAFPAEEDPFGEAVVGFNLVRGGRDLLRELNVGDILESSFRRRVDGSTLPALIDSTT